MSLDQGEDATRAPVTITLSGAQVAHIARGLSGGSSVTGFVAGLTGAVGFQDSVESMLSDARYSHSLLKALLVLAAFPMDGSELALSDVTGQLNWSPSTTHRYFVTWTAVGALERNPDTRRYRRAALPRETAHPVAEAGTGGAARGD
jgi:hypothetical protein